MAVLDQCGDTSFGPRVQADCRGGFDFTVVFEESILSLLPATCFLLLVPLRIINLLHKRIKARRNALYTLKLLSIAIYALLQLTLLLLWATDPLTRTALGITSATINVLVSAALVLLSHLEHVKSIRPSFLISFYLLASLVFDVARARTQWLLPEYPAREAVAGIFTAAVGVKVVVIVLEGLGKRSILLDAWRGASRESTSGAFGRSLFWWLNGLLVQGFRRVLGVDDLFSISERLGSERLAEKLQRRWDGCDQKRKHALAIESFHSLRWEVLQIVLPRLSLVALSITQPFLITETVAFIQTDKPTNIGYGLIGGYAFVYIGSAITTGWYQHLSFRLMTMIRGSLISIIYQKMMNLKSANANESAAMNLMGTEVERIVETWYLLVVNIWASILQLGIAVFLLERQLGAVCIAPIVIALVATGSSSKLATFVAGRQKIWLEAVQSRLNFTSEILGSMMSVKMLGLTDRMTTIIQGMRVKEMNLSKRFRRLSSLSVCIVNLPSILTRLATFAAFAIVAKIKGSNSINTSLVITSLAILDLLGNPLSELLYAIPQAYAALGCFQRIQEFLLMEDRSEQRQIGSEQFITAVGARGHDQTGADIELASLHGYRRSISNSLLDTIEVRRGEFGWSELRTPTINGVDLHLRKDVLLTVGCVPKSRKS